MCDCKQSIGQRIGAAAGELAVNRLKRTGVYQGAKGLYDDGRDLYRGVKKVGKFLGIGDYVINSNSLVSGGMNSNIQLPQYGLRDTVIRHREYVGDVFTSSTAGAWQVQGFSINPGLFTTFPWLSCTALNYDQYVPMGIVFEFKSTCAELSSTATYPSVVMATEYDVLDRIPSSKQEMLGMAFSAEGKATEDMLHGLECAPQENARTVFFTRSGSVTADLQDYDLATFYIATVGGNTANLNIGSLYVHYEFAFRKEQLFVGPFLRNANYACWRATGATNIIPLGNVATTFATRTGFANTLTVSTLSTGSTTDILVSNDQILWHPRWKNTTWRLTVSWTGAALAIAYPLITTTITDVGLFLAQDATPVAATNSTKMTISWFISIPQTVTVAPQGVTFSAGPVNVPTNATVDFGLVQVNNEAIRNAISASVIMNT